MKHIVLSGYYGFNNAGDEAVLKSIVNDLYAQDLHLKLTVLSNQPKETMIYYRAQSINRWDIKALIKTLKEADLLISGGGSLLQDVTSPHGFLYYLGVIGLAKLLKVPVMIYAQGLGPLNRPLSRWLSGSVLRFVNYATFRDEDSLRLFNSLGHKMPEASLCFDPVLGYEPQELPSLLGENTSGKKRLLFALRAWQGLNSDLFKKAIKALEDEYEIYLLPMHKGSDTHFAKLILHKTDTKAVLLRDDYSLDELMSLFKEVDIVVSMRLHGLIMAANQKKPILALSYDPKCDSFMKSLGDSNVLSIDKLTTENLIYRIKTLKTTPDYLEKLNTYKQNAKRPAEIAVNLVKK